MTSSDPHKKEIQDLAEGHQSGDLEDPTAVMECMRNIVVGRLQDIEEKNPDVEEYAKAAIRALDALEDNES